MCNKKLMNSKEEENWVTFPAKVERKFRIWIPRYVREIMKIDEGDYVEIKIRKIKKHVGLRI